MMKKSTIFNIFKKKEIHEQALIPFVGMVLPFVEEKNGDLSRVGWICHGYTLAEDYDKETGIATYEVHSIFSCNSILHVGIMSEKAFKYCPTCLVVVEVL